MLLGLAVFAIVVALEVALHALLRGILVLPIPHSFRQSLGHYWIAYPLDQLVKPAPRRRPSSRRRPLAFLGWCLGLLFLGGGLVLLVGGVRRP
jgi:hypothetical protein